MTAQNRAAGWGIFLGIALISAATLAVQVLQTRLFSVMLWHHLTYMVVTVTLLGFGAGGSLLALFPSIGRAHDDPRVSVSTCCSLFGITLIGAFAILTHSPLDTLDVDADRKQYFFLFLHYAYLVVPFLFAGLAIAIALQQFGKSVHKTYFFNLIGSGIGAFLFLLLVRDVGGPGCLFLFASLGGLAGWVSLSGEREQSVWPTRLLAVVALAIWPLAHNFPGAADKLVPIRPAESKAQTTFEALYGALDRYYGSQDPAYEADETTSDPKLRRTIWSPTCRIDTVPIPKTPGGAKKDREEPGKTPRAQVHVFQDGDAPTVIWSGTYAQETKFEMSFYGLGYSLVDEPRALIIGPGGGNDVEQALHHGAKTVTAVDINGDTLRMVREDFGEFTDHVYERDRVEWQHSEGRSFLRRAGKEGRVFDSLQMSGTDTYAALSSGSYIFSESYLYTVEAFDDYYRHIAEDGVISIIRFRFEPPREALKLVATAATALRKLGIEDPRKHFILVNHEDNQPGMAAELLERHAGQHPHDPRLSALKQKFDRFYREPMRYAVMLTRKQPFTDEDVKKVEAALGPMNPDWKHNDKALVSNRLYYAGGFRDGDIESEYGKLLGAMADGKTEEFITSYPYRIEPATDDKPFFFNFHSWSDLFAGAPNTEGDEEPENAGSTPEPKQGPGYEALTGSEPIGLYVLAALLIQTLIATFLLIVLPLFRLGFRSETGQSRLKVFGYFLLLGFAYLLVEISTIQRFVLYLGHPTLSLSVVLATFLVSSGLGSAVAGLLGGRRWVAWMSAILVVGLLAAHAFVLPGWLAETLEQSESSRIAMAIATIAPLAFAMGMPFPTGLGLLHGESPGMVSWAFGVNGAASVMASILAIVLAMETGFGVVTLTAAALYLIAAVLVPRAPDAATQE